MSLQKHFNLKRFYKALRYDLALNLKTYLFFVIGLLIGLFFIDLFFINVEYKTFSLRNYQPLFFFTFIGSMIFVTGSSFPLLRRKKSMVNYLMLPVSVFEKFLLQFCIRIIGFIVLFIPLFWFSFILADFIYNLFEWRNHTEVESFTIFFDAFNGIKTALDVWALVLAIFSLASFFFAGAVYFKKYAVFKTILGFTVLMFLIYLVFVILSYLFLPGIDKDLGIRVYTRKINKDLFNVQVYFYVLGMLTSLFLMPFAYFKLKEKEL